MAYPNIASNTDQPPLWKRGDELSNLSKDALKYLLLEARHVVDAMECELRCRGLPVPHNLLDTDYNRIKFVSHEIEQCGLKDNATKAAHELKTALTTNYSAHKLDSRKVAAGKFLCDVTRNCGCEVALICFIALGKHKLERMGKSERLELLVRLKKNKSDLVPIIVVEFVTKYGFRDITRLHDLIKPEPVVYDPTKEKSLPRKRTWNNAFPFSKEEERYQPFMLSSRLAVGEMPEPFYSGIEMSKLWKEELNRGGLEVTNCLTLYLPETVYADAFLSMRIGYDYGFDIAKLFKFGEFKNLPSAEAAKFA